MPLVLQHVIFRNNFEASSRYLRISSDPEDGCSGVLSAGLLSGATSTEGLGHVLLLSSRVLEFRVEKWLNVRQLA